MDDTRKFLLFLAAVLVAAISYYFAIALPARDRDRLAFEKQKYEQQEKERHEKEAAASKEEASKRGHVLQCQVSAETTYWDYVKLNGHEIHGKPGAYTAPEHIWEAARKNKKDSYDECMALQ